MAYCSKCGSKLSEKHNFCQKCGFKIKIDNFPEKSDVRESMIIFKKENGFPLTYLSFSIIMLIFIFASLITMEGACIDFSRSIDSRLYPASYPESPITPESCKENVGSETFTYTTVLGPSAISLYHIAWITILMISIIYLILNLIKKRFKYKLYLSISGFLPLIFFITGGPKPIFGIILSAILYAIFPIVMMILAIKSLKEAKN